MRGKRIAERTPCQILKPRPRHTLGKLNFVFSIFHKEGAYHSQIGVMTHTLLIISECILTAERDQILVDFLHIGIHIL